MEKYNKLASNFLKATDTTVTTEFLKNDFHFDNDVSTRDIYKVTIKRGNRKFTFDFSQSLMDSQKYIKTYSNGKTVAFTPSGYGLEGITSIRDVGNYMKGFAYQNRPKLVKGHAPTEYDILASLTKHDVGSFDDFCSEFGYNLDSRSAKKIYKAVVKEYNNVCKIWSDDEIEMLREIW